ncbi:MAG: TlpA disulfide reductase family protein [Bacteroidota bacterium]|nr:TlpA disulfide reductase family protein [Bacteroidota bacterium]
MRKLILITFAVFVAFACSKKSQEGGFVISGTLSGITDGKVILQPLEPDLNAKADTAIITKGTFEFRGKLAEPDVYVLSVDGRESKLMFFLENSKITIKGSADSLAKAEVKGSASNNDQKLFRSMVDSLQKVYSVESIVKEYNMSNDARKVEIRAVFNKFQNKADSLQKTFIKRHPKSYFSAYALRNISYSLTTVQLDEMIKGFDASLQNYKYIRILKERIKKLKAVEIGKIAPDFTLNDKDGNPVKLSEQYAKSQYLLVDFWASWCGPCRAENPAVVAAFNKFNSRGFNIVGVSLDENRDMWIQAIEKDGLTWTHVSDLKGWKSSIAQLYAVTAIPSNFLVDKTGTIIAINLRGEELNQKLQELMYSAHRSYDKSAPATGTATSTTPAAEPTTAPK